MTPGPGMGTLVSYPFGIGPGCFRQGFELTCDNTTGSPRLIFQLGNNSTQVTSIDVGSNYVGASVVGCGVDTTGFRFFAECLRHSAKAKLHSAKPLPSAALGKEHTAKI